MNSKAEPAPTSRTSVSDRTLTVVNMRLKKLRHERHFIEKAIVALTRVSWSQKSRERRGTRN